MTPEHQVIVDALRAWPDVTDEQYELLKSSACVEFWTVDKGMSRAGRALLAVADELDAVRSDLVENDIVLPGSKRHVEELKYNIKLHCDERDAARKELEVEKLRSAYWKAMVEKLEAWARIGSYKGASKYNVVCTAVAEALEALKQAGGEP